MMKYFSQPKDRMSKGPRIVVCIISRNCVLLVVAFLVCCLVCFPLIQLTHIPRLVKSKFEKISFFSLFIWTYDSNVYTTNMSNVHLQKDV